MPDDDQPQRPHRPLVTREGVLLAIELGARCPHQLADIFDVHVLHPDLIHAVNALAFDGMIAAGRKKHVGPSGVTCSPIVLTSAHGPAL